MFRKRRGPDEPGGFNRISRLIEDRQRELEEGDGAEEAPLDDDTIEMHSAPARVGYEQDDNEPDDTESVTLLGLRGAATPTATAPYDNAEDDEDEAAGQRASSVATASPAYDDDEEDEATGDGGYRSYAAPVATFDEPPISPPAAATRPMTVPDLGRAGASGSLVAAEATWEGTLRSDGDIRVDGVLRGEVETAATLIVSPSARIHGTVHARNVMLAGDLEGDVICEDRLEILPGGSARGQINSGTLVVHEGAYIDSRFQMRRDQASPAG